MIIPRTINEFTLSSEEIGVGLAIKDGKGRYLFFVAGSKYQCMPGELFYAGIGGHCEPNESWIECAKREAREEIDIDVQIVSSSGTWYMPVNHEPRNIGLLDEPQPLALYDMTHAVGTPNEGQVYKLIIYTASINEAIHNLSPSEIRAVIALTPRQILQGLERKMKISELIKDGASIVATTGEVLPSSTLLFPIGTAIALAKILKEITSV